MNSMTIFLEKLFLLNLQFCNYEKVAEGYGGVGQKIGSENDSTLHEVFQEAFRDLKKGKPILLNCLIGKTDFREGSISV